MKMLLIKSRNVLILIVLIIMVISFTIFYTLHQDVFISSTSKTRLMNIIVSSSSIGSSIITLVKADEFDNITQPYNTNNGFYDFVLKPGSTGYITMTYDLAQEDIVVGPPHFKVQTHINSTTQNYFGVFLDSTVSNFLIRSVHITKLYDKFNPNSTEIGIHIPSGTGGINIYPSEIVNLTDHSINVTYTLSTNASSEKGTYYFTLFGTACPGELLTIGDKPYEGKLPWDNNTKCY